MTGGLFDPLGTDRGEPGRPGARVSAPVALAGLLLAALAALLAVSYLRDTGDRGLPVAVAPIERLPPAPAVPAAPVPAAPVPPAPPPAAQQPAAPVGVDQDVQIENGVRVVRPRRDPRPAALPPAPPAGLPSTVSPPQGGQILRVPDGRPVR